MDEQTLLAEQTLPGVAPTAAGRRRSPTERARRLRHHFVAALRRDLVALLVFLAVAILATYPMLADPRGSLLGGLGDNVQYVYIMGWMGQALTIGQSPFVDPRLNYPDDLLITATDVPYLHFLALAPVTLTLGPIFSYNLLVFAGYVLTGYITYLWVRQLTGSRAGGIVAGLALTLNPQRVIRSLGHPQMIPTYTLVLFFWALHQVVATERPRRRDLLLLAGATWLLGSSSQYLLVIGLLCGAFYALLLLIPRWSYLLRHGWAVSLAVISGSLAGAAPYLVNARDSAYKPYLFNDVRLWAADPLFFFQPWPLHPLWGAWVNHLRPNPLFGETAVYVGLVALALALVALLWRGSPHQRFKLAWVGTGLLAAVFALGMDLHLAGQPVNVEQPVYLPAYYLSQLPLVSSMRIWPRFAIVSALAVALLAGLGVALLCARFPRRATLIGAGLAVLVVIDLLPGITQASPLTTRPIDHWLAAQPGDFAVAFLPPSGIAGDHYNYLRMYGSLTHAKHLPAFNHPYHQSQAYAEYMDRTQGFPAAESIAKLRNFRVRYLILEHALFDPSYGNPPLAEVLATVRASPDLMIVAELEGMTVIAFTAGDE
jgi:hypothetical protein